MTSLVLNNLAANRGYGPLAAMGVAVRIAQIPEFLLMAITVGAVAAFFAVTVFLFRDQVFSAFVADPAVLAVGVTIVTAQFVAMIANAFAGLITSFFQATGRALAATIMSVTQGVLFLPRAARSAPRTVLEQAA